jgi:hypothetical protein
MPKNFLVVPAPKVIPVPAVPPTGIVPRKMPQNAPNGTKNANALYVPMAQQQRIVQLRQMGKSVREISPPRRPPAQRPTMQRTRETAQPGPIRSR